MEALFFILGGNAVLIPIEAAPLCFPSNSVLILHFLASSRLLCFDGRRSNWCDVLSIFSCTCWHPLMNKGVKISALYVHSGLLLSLTKKGNPAVSTMCRNPEDITLSDIRQHGRMNTEDLTYMRTLK